MPSGGATVTPSSTVRPRTFAGDTTPRAVWGTSRVTEFAQRVQVEDSYAPSTSIPSRIVKSAPLGPWYANVAPHAAPEATHTRFATLRNEAAKSIAACTLANGVAPSFAFAA